MWPFLFRFHSPKSNHFNANESRKCLEHEVSAFPYYIDVYNRVLILVYPLYQFLRWSQYLIRHASSNHKLITTSDNIWTQLQLLKPQILCESIRSQTYENDMSISCFAQHRISLLPPSYKNLLGYGRFNMLRTK